MAKRIYKISSIIAFTCMGLIACEQKKTSETNASTTTIASTAPPANVVSTPTDAPKQQTGEKGDTLFVVDKALVTHLPSKAELKKWKAAGPEFEESLSDNLFYLEDTKTNSKQLNLKMIETEKDIIVFVKSDGKQEIWARGKKYDGWGAIAFTPSKAAKTIQIVNSKDELTNYFK